MNAPVFLSLTIEIRSVSPTKKNLSTRKKAKGEKPTDIFPLQGPRGTQDVLPEEQKYWEYVIETAKMVLRGWDFQRVDTPIFEETTLENAYDCTASQDFFFVRFQCVSKSLIGEGYPLGGG